MNNYFSIDDRASFFVSKIEEAESNDDLISLLEEMEFYGSTIKAEKIIAYSIFYRLASEGSGGDRFWDRKDEAAEMIEALLDVWGNFDSDKTYRLVEDFFFGRASL